MVGCKGRFVCPPNGIKYKIFHFSCSRREERFFHVTFISYVRDFGSNLDNSVQIFLHFTNI
jgi:hypothetical protein